MNKHLKVLDLGAGPWKHYSYAISLDWNPKSNPDIIWDLNKFPYPFEDNEFDIVYACHILEHLDNPIKVLEEIWRILKPNGKLVLKTPHFSCRTAYGNPEHKHYFSSLLFDYFEREKDFIAKTNAKFIVEKIKLVWSPPEPKSMRDSQKKFQPLIKILNSFFSFFANINIDFCERFWCYFVGGFAEIQFEVRTVKG
ncbi:MAG: class I SAM-dependent methyltransferase [Endomicrobia bacterium]|nr:class I SAM-dependent methyltransferase [Endomicrobiia bacterium]MDW8055177.1 methyltransferase domain-containing protein [Elusimicrobiota bacterium]